MIVVVGEWVVNGGGGFVVCQWRRWSEFVSVIKRRIGKVREERKKKKKNRMERKEKIIIFK